jgi:hypothetical protein
MASKFMPGRSKGTPGKGSTPWTDAADDKADKQSGISEGSARDLALDQQRGVPEDDIPAKKPAIAPKFSKRRPQRG